MKFTVPAFLIPLALLPLADAAPAHVSTKAGQVTVRAQAGGRVLLTVPADARQTVSAEQQGQSLLVTLVRQQPSQITLIALNAITGRRLWKQAFAANFNKTYTHGGQFFVEYATSGAQLNIHTLIWDGRSATTEEIPGRMLARSAAALLFNTENDMNPYEPAQLKLVRYTPRVSESSVLNYVVPGRPDCGDFELDVTEGEATKFTGKYVYAIRRDRCGTFVARFDWTGESTKPLVYPKSQN